MAQDSSTGGSNSIFGTQAATGTTGMRNTMLGFRAGFASTSADSNVYIGYEAGSKITTGDYNVCVGQKSGPSSTSTESNKLYINNDEGTPLIGGDFSADEIYLNGDVGIGTTSPDYQLDVRKAGYEVMLVSGQSNGNYPVAHFIDSTDQWPAWFEGNRTGDPGAGIRLWHNPSSIATNNNTYVQFCMQNAADQRTVFANLKAGIDVNTDGAEGGNIQFQLMKAGTLTEVARFQDEGRLGIGTTAPNVELHVNGDGRFEENHKLYFSDSATDVFIRGASSDLELHSSDDIYINATDDIRIASDQVTFADDADNVHLTIMETGTNSALLSGANSAGLYFATQSGTRLELTGNHIIKTGQTIDNMLSYATAAVHTATTATQTYQIESQANPGQAGVTHTVTLNLPNGTVGGERFTVTCIAIGSFKPGTGNLTGEVVLGGTFINGTNLASPTVTSFTGATAAGANVMQVKTYEFTWVASQFNPSGIGGWVYTYNTM